MTRSPASIRSPARSSSARWMTFSSSRQLPGQSWPISRSSAAGGREGQGRAGRAVAQEQRGGDRADVEPARSRSGVQGHRHDVEAPVEIGAEAAGGDFGGEVAIGAGDDAHVDRLGADRADRQDLALLQRAEQLGLERERDLGDLVEQQGAAVGGAEQALAVRAGAGEGALAVAEQDRLEHRLGERGAIDRGERAVARAASRRGCSGRGLPCRCRSRRAAARRRRWRRCGAAKSSAAALAGSPQAGRPAGRTSSAASALPKARSSSPKARRAGAVIGRAASERGRGAKVDDQVVRGGADALAGGEDRRGPSRQPSAAAKIADARPAPDSQPASAGFAAATFSLNADHHSPPDQLDAAIVKQAACQDAAASLSALVRARARAQREASARLTPAASKKRRLEISRLKPAAGRPLTAFVARLGIDPAAAN